MKKYICILLVSAISVLLYGCTMYSDKDYVGDAADDLSTVVYLNMVSPVFYIAELADFYEAYLEIWEDRGTSLLLASEYFGDHKIQLHYQDITVYPWGKIAKTDIEHFYLSEQSSPYAVPATYSVTAVGERKYEIECESVGTESDSWKKFIASAVVSVGDNDISAERMEIYYVDINDIALQVECREPLISKRDCCSYPYNMPYSGVLDYNVSGGICDAFTVKFLSGGVALVED